MNGGNKFVVIIGVLASLMGTVASIITIFVFMDSSPESLSISWIKSWSTDEIMQALSGWAEPYIGWWPLGSVLTALAVYAVTATIAYAIDDMLIWEPGEIFSILLFTTPLVLFWLLLFWQKSDILAVGLFLAGYLVLPWSSLFAGSILYEYVEERRENSSALVGSVRGVKKTVGPNWGNLTSFEFILDRKDDVPAKVKYLHTSFNPLEKKLSAKCKIRVTGTWGKDGVFSAKHIEFI